MVLNRRSVFLLCLFAFVTVNAFVFRIKILVFHTYDTCIIFSSMWSLWEVEQIVYQSEGQWFTLWLFQSAGLYTLSDL